MKTIPTTINRPALHDTDHQKLTSKYQWGVFACIFLWPFIYLFKDILLYDGKYTEIGQDFYPLYYKYKVYLLAGLAEGHLPLWSPSEGAGYPFFSNPFAGVFYPLNLLLVPYYKIIPAYTPLNHQIFTILGLGLFALGLFCWLKQILPNIRIVLLGVLIMSVCFKMTEILRFPNAVHTAAWYPWIFYAITRLFQTLSRKNIVLITLLLFFSVICLCTAGYPYYVYYTIFLFPPYLLILFLRPLRLQLLGLDTIRWRQGIVCLTIAGGCAGLLVFPYFIAIQKLMAATQDRTGKSFAYSTAHIFNIQDTLGSLIYPPFAQAEGWYFFSITGLLIIALFPYLLYKAVQNNSSLNTIITHGTNCRWGGFLYLFLWIVIVSYISYGKSSWLFKFFWYYLPGFSSLRVWGRLNIILVPLIAWLLCMAYAFLENLIFSIDHKNTGRMNRVHTQAILYITAIYLIILSTQYFLYSNNLIDNYWNIFPCLSGLRFHFITMGIIAYSILVILILFAARLPQRLHPKYFTIFLLAAVAMAEMWPVGAHTWTKDNSILPPQTKFNLNNINNRSFWVRRSNNGTISLTPTFNVNLVQNWYFGQYVAFYNRFESESRYRNILLGVTTGQKVFYSESIAYESIQLFLNDSLRFAHPGQLIFYNGDVLTWDINSPAAGYLSFIDNWDPFWKAYVDGKEVPIERLFGTFKAVRLSQGKHRVQFRYEPTLKTVILGTP